jgi:hypothetical protein
MFGVSVAQRTEHPSSKRRVAGSIPAGDTSADAAQDTLGRGRPDAADVQLSDMADSPGWYAPWMSSTVMDDHTIKTSDRRIRLLLASCHPDWLGKRVTVATQDRYQIDGWRWDGAAWREDAGGHARRYVCTFDLRTGRASGSGCHVPLDLDNRARATLSVRSGVALVERRVVGGRSDLVTVVVHPEDLARFGLALSGVRRAASSAGGAP